MVGIKPEVIGIISRMELKDYLFESGKMVTNGISWYKEAIYYAGSDGVVVTTAGWKETAEGWIYIQAGGKLAGGVQKIDGKIYYFNSRHCLVE